MRYNFIGTFFLVLMVSLASAQEYTITGYVKNPELEGIVFANVLLLTEEGTLVKGTTTNVNGAYEFKDIAKGSYTVKASYIENTVETAAILLSKDLEVPDLVLQNSQELDEVTVVRQKPRLEQLADRLVFNIENTALSDNDIWNVLKRTPGVIVMNNSLSINGNSNIGVMINGRRVNLPKEDIMNLLSGNSASNVEAIEVITNPPAKYSAEGGLLIDIKMKKNLIAGYNGSVFNRYSQAVLPKHTLGTDHFFKGKNIDFSTNYSFRNNRDLVRYTDITNFFENGQPNETWAAEQKSVDRRKSHNLSMFLDYNLNDKNELSFSVFNAYSPFLTRNLDSETLITDTAGNQTSSFTTSNALDYEIVNSSFYLDWNRKLNDKGALLSLSTNFTYYDFKQAQALNNVFFNANADIVSNDEITSISGQITNLYSLQADVTVPLSVNSKMETGVRYAGINSEACIEQMGLDRIFPGADPTISGIFNYDEDIFAAYLSLNNSWEKWKLNLGLRTEYTDTNGVLDSDANVNNTSYLEWFPSFSANYSINKKNSIFLKYYRRISRPRYRSINPFQYFQTANSVVEGNPALRPSIQNTVQFEYTLDRTYRFVLFANKKTNEQLQQVFQDNEDNLLLFQYINLDKNYDVGADISYSKDITNTWNTYFLLSYFYDENSFRDVGSNTLIKNTIWSTHVRATNSFKFLKDKSLYADLTYMYFSPRVNGNATTSSFSELGLSFRKNLWNKAASVSLAIEDIFNNGNRVSTINYLDQSNSTFARRETRLFVFGFRYKFGNTKIRDNYKRKNTEENRRL